MKHTDVQHSLLPSLLPTFTALLENGDFSGYIQELTRQGLGWLFHCQIPLLKAHCVPLRKCLSGDLPPPRIQLLMLAINPETDSSLHDLEQLYEVFLQQGDREAVSASIGLALQLIIDSGYAFQRFTSWRERAQQLLKEDSLSPLASAFVHMLLAWTEIMGPGDIEAAYTALESMHRYAEQAQAPSLRVFHAILVAYISFWRGELGALEVVLADVGPFLEDPQLSPLAVLQYRSAQGLLKTLQGAPEEGRNIYLSLLEEPMIELVSPSIWLQVQGNYLYTLAMLTDLDEVEKIGTVMLARTVLEYNHYYHSYLHFNLGIVSLLLDRPHKALFHASECGKYGELCGSCNVARMSAMVIGQALMELGRDNDALDHFRTWMPTWIEARYFIVAALGAVEMGYLLLQQGKIDQARDALQGARTLIPKNEPIATLHRPGDYIHRLEGMLFHPQSVSPWARQESLVTITTFGEFRVTLYGGKTLYDRNWHGFMAKKLLKAIIALGGSRVSTERLAYMLWPDADGDNAMNAFKVTLSRLRTILAGGNKKLRGILVVKQKRISLSSTFCRVDALAFSDSVLKACDPVLQADAMEAALGLYGGNFLESSSDYWIISAREELLGKFVCGSLQLCDIFWADKDVKRIIPLLTRAMKFDPVNEEVCARLMQAHFLFGNRAKSLDIYNNMSIILYRELGIEPGPMLQKIYQQIREK